LACLPRQVSRAPPLLVQTNLLPFFFFSCGIFAFFFPSQLFSSGLNCQCTSCELGSLLCSKLSKAPVPLFYRPRAEKDPPLSHQDRLQTILLIFPALVSPGPTTTGKLHTPFVGTPFVPTRNHDVSDVGNAVCSTPSALRTGQSCWCFFYLGTSMTKPILTNQTFTLTPPFVNA